MTIKKAVAMGFIKGVDGAWRKPITRISKGKTESTFQKYLSMNCKQCGNEFVASHRKNIFCSHSCHMKNIIQLHRDWGEWNRGKTFPYKPRPRPKNYRVKMHGYIWVHEPFNSMCNKRGYVAEHRFVMSEKLGRALASQEFVHHINGDRSDNRIENLVMVSIQEHNSIHKKEESKKRSRNKIGRFI